MGGKYFILQKTNYGHGEILAVNRNVAEPLFHSMFLDIPSFYKHAPPRWMLRAWNKKSPLIMDKGHSKCFIRLLPVCIMGLMKHLVEIKKPRR